MPKINVGNVTLHYELSGRKGAPCVVLSHSLGADMSTWQPQMPALEQHLSVLRYDMRGHGQSSVPEGPYSIADLAGDVLKLVDALGLGKVMFCGMSIGGAIGQWLGVHAPERLQRLLICDTASKIGTKESWEQRIAQVREGGTESIADATMERWFTERFRQQQPGKVAEVRRVLASMSDEGYMAACAALRDFDIRDLVGTIPVPTRIISGLLDETCPVKEAEALHAAIQGSSLVLVPGAHLSSMEAEPEFTAAAVSFLEASSTS